MNTNTRVIILGLVICAVIVVVALKNMQSTDASQAGPTPAPVAAPAATPVPAGPTEATEVATGLPKLLDLGSTTCIPCKMMEPILNELKTEYEGRMEVEFVDIYANPSKASQYGISLIPTQIFLSAEGEQLFRHEGFYAKDDILAKWRELGVAFD